MSGSYVLVGDIGGTNARLALAELESMAISHTGFRKTADFATIGEAIRSYLAEEGAAHPITRAVLAVACPADVPFIRFTNNHWAFEVATLQAELGFSELRVINDFTAQALAIPFLKDDEKKAIGGGAAVVGAPIAVLGAGTGLGVSGLVPNGAGGYVPLAGEGGHISLAPEDELEIDILRHAWRVYGRTSNERIFSGSGLAFLFEALCTIYGVAKDPLAPEQVVARAQSGECALCHETIMRFCAMFGTVAGDLALTLGAKGGVYIAGGVIPRFGQLFFDSPFRARFENKARFRDYVSRIPTYLVLPHDNPALLGAASVLK